MMASPTKNAVDAISLAFQDILMRIDAAERAEEGVSTNHASQAAGRAEIDLEALEVSVVDHR